jgi:hypothetical protein
MSKIGYLTQTSTRGALGPEDYVDWAKIDERANELRKEIVFLEALRHSRRPTEELRELLIDFPRTLDVIRFLLAHRPDEIRFADGRRIQFKEDIEVLASGNGAQRASEIADILLGMHLIEFLDTTESVRECVRYVLVALESDPGRSR